jgi:hypothetical protein
LLLFMLVKLKLILMLLMPQPICEGCWWHGWNYICNFLISLYHCIDWIVVLNIFCNFCVVCFNKKKICQNLSMYILEDL